MTPIILSINPKQYLKVPKKIKIKIVTERDIKYIYRKYDNYMGNKNELYN